MPRYSFGRDEAMKVFFESLGCRLNEAELETWRRALARVGGEAVASPGQAQVMVLNSCAVTLEAARKSRKRTRRLHRHNPAAKLVLTGCFAQLEPQHAAAIAGVDLVIGNGDKDRLVEIMHQRLDLSQAPLHTAVVDGDRTHLLGETHLFREAHLFRPTRTRAFVKVQDGCRNRCTFCIVTIARGEERSRPIDEVVDEINRLHADGYQEVVLSGVHLGGYGHDRGRTLHQLVAAVLERTAIPRVRLSSLEPWDLPVALWQLWRDRRLCPHLHLPLQSGSDDILRRMARRTTVDQFRQIVDQARGAIPQLSLTTDVIVGFPGETEQHWQQTLSSVEAMGFAHIHVFAYSPRPGTAAAGFAEQVPEDVKRARSKALHRLAAQSKRRFLQQHLGQCREVLWEGSAVRQADGGLHARGLTDNYLRVETQVASADELENRITPSRLVAIDDSGEVLRATLPAATAVV